MLLHLDGGSVRGGNAVRLKDHFREAEVKNLRLPASCHKDVRRLDATVDDALRVFDIESIGDVYAQIEHRLDLYCLAADPVPQCVPVKQFHCYEDSSINLVDFVDGANVWVVQRGRSFGFSLKTAESLSNVGEFFGEELQGDVATELEVFGLVHNAHAPTADPAEDAVMGNGLPHGLGGHGH